jgi:hypothetical protein
MSPANCPFTIRKREAKKFGALVEAISSARLTMHTGSDSQSADDAHRLSPVPGTARSQGRAWNGHTRGAIYWFQPWGLVQCRLFDRQLAACVLQLLLQRHGLGIWQPRVQHDTIEHCIGIERVFEHATSATLPAGIFNIKREAFDHENEVHRPPHPRSRFF